MFHILWNSIIITTIPLFQPCSERSTPAVWSPWGTCRRRTPRSWAGVVGEEGGEEAAAGHEGRTLTLELNLTQQARDLHAVHLGAVRSGGMGMEMGTEWNQVWDWRKWWSGIETGREWNQVEIWEQYQENYYTYLNIYEKVCIFSTHSWALCSRLHHQLQAVARKRLVQTSRDTGSETKRKWLPKWNVDWDPSLQQ